MVFIYWLQQLQQICVFSLAHMRTHTHTFLLGQKKPHRVFGEGCGFCAAFFWGGVEGAAMTDGDFGTNASCSTIAQGPLPPHSAPRAV